MKNEDLSPEMSVIVEFDETLRFGKVIGPTTLKQGSLVQITGWVVALEPDHLHVTVTADKIQQNGPITISDLQHHKLLDEREELQRRIDNGGLDQKRVQMILARLNAISAILNRVKTVV